MPLNRTSSKGIAVNRDIIRERFDALYSRNPKLLLWVCGLSASFLMTQVLDGFGLFPDLPWYDALWWLAVPAVGLALRRVLRARATRDHETVAVTRLASHPHEGDASAQEAHGDTGEIPAINDELVRQVVAIREGQQVVVGTDDPLRDLQPPTDVSSPIRSELLEGEVLLHDRPMHPLTLLKLPGILRSKFGVITAVVAVVILSQAGQESFAVPLAAVLILIVLYAVYRFADWRNDRLAYTYEYVYKSSGVFETRVQTAYIDEMSDVIRTQNLWQKMLPGDPGDLHFESKGQADLKNLRWVWGARQVEQEIKQIIRRNKAKADEAAEAQLRATERLSELQQESIGLQRQIVEFLRGKSNSHAE